MTDWIKRADNAEAEIKDEQRILATNAWHLARYVLEHDHEISLPDKFKAGQFFNWCERYPELGNEEKIRFVDEYARLEKISKNVTARTLVATRIHGHGFCHAACRTSVGRYLVFLFTITIILTLSLVLLFFLETAKTDNWISISMAFIAAGLGTCVYLLRVTQEKLKTRTFDPAYIPSQLIRLVLGILAGGTTVVLFPELMTLGGVANTSKVTGYGEISMSGLLIAFILGYAVDMYYAILDNIGGKIKSTKTT